MNQLLLKWHRKCYQNKELDDLLIDLLNNSIHLIMEFHYALNLNRHMKV